MTHSVSEEQKNRVITNFTKLRDQICAAFETLEIDYEGDSFKHEPPGRFEYINWQRPDESVKDAGGGTMGAMKGRVFEKVGVNISTVHGTFSEEFRAKIPGAEKNGQFWASGISLVAHMQSPLVPAVHMNLRHIITEKSWFGGGSDLNPIFPNTQDTEDFHASLKQACDKHDEGYYPKYKQACDDYFFLPHRGEHRGVGGIFVDYHNTENWDQDFAFVQDIGKTFLQTYPMLVRRHMNKKWNKDQRYEQLVRRGRYAEFNLLHDRGTVFGLKTGGNIDAILMSMPPTVIWE